MTTRSAFPHVSRCSRLNLLNRTDAAAAAVTLSTCGTVLLLLIAAQSSSSTTSASHNLPFKLCERALELLRDVDAKSIMPLHVHAQVMLLEMVAILVMTMLPNSARWNTYVLDFSEVSLYYSLLLQLTE